MNRVLAAFLAIALWVVTSTASAHHVPGHGASEGVRNLNSMGGATGRATSRFLVLQEFSRNSTSQNPGTTYVTSLAGAYAPHPWFSFGLQPTLLVVDEDNADSTKVGVGDTRVTLRLTPHADKLIHRVVTAGLTISAPTRTVRFSADPGRTWIVSPSVMFTRTYGQPFWQLMGLATIEHRPAGTAVDVSGGAMVGYRAWGKLTPALAVLGDLRVATFCQQPSGGAKWCDTGRATENGRDQWSLRVANVASLSYAFKPWGIVSGSVQFPLTHRRDFDVAGSLSVQFLL